MGLANAFSCESQAAFHNPSEHIDVDIRLCTLLTNRPHNLSSKGDF